MEYEHGVGSRWAELTVARALARRSETACDSVKFPAISSRELDINPALWNGGRTSRTAKMGKVQGGTKCVKYLLFIFNFIFWVSFSLLNHFRRSKRVSRDMRLRHDTGMDHTANPANSRTDTASTARVCLCEIHTAPFHLVYEAWDIFRFLSSLPTILMISPSQ